MRLAKGWPRIEAASNPQRVADLSYREALGLLCDRRGAGEEKPPAEVEPDEHPWLSDLTVESRRHLSEKWWDILATAVVLMDAADWTPEDMADFMGMPVRDVQLVLQPDPPMRFDTPHNGDGIVPLNGTPGCWKRAQRMHRLYRDTTDAIVARILWTVYLQAAYHAKRQGNLDLAGRLENMSRHHAKRAARLQEAEDVMLRGEDQEDIGCLWQCAFSDARAALGIEPPEPYLSSLWEKATGRCPRWG
jgi:hypothetical protein